MKLTEKKINIGLLVFFIGIGLYFAIKATKGLVLPVEDDDFRDMSIAENLLHGNFFSDPTYLHELFWYNPLMPATDAIISAITGLPLNIVVTHAGKFLNLLIPLSLYFMCYRLFDKRIALAAAASSIFFVCGNDYGEHMSGYTYILISMVFSQAIFYLVITYAYKTYTKLAHINFILLGICMGIMFLFHSAPTVLSCLIFMCLFVHALLKKELTFAQVITKGVLFSVPFLLIASPLLYSIFGHYHYEVKNEDPMQWVYILFRPGQGERLIQETLNVYTVIAIIGLVALIRSKQVNTIAKRIVLYWFFCSLVLFLYVYSIGIIKDVYHISLPGFVPSCDVFFYVKAAESVLIAFGIWQIVAWIQQLLAGKISVQPAIILYSFICLLVLLRMPGYASRKEFSYLPHRTLERQQTIYSNMSTYDWIKKNTNINDVILCAPEQANFPVMASGRKMVAAVTYYSSPYVSYINRQRDEDSMLNGLKSNENIRSLLNSYEVKYLLLPATQIQQYPLATHYFPKVAYSDKDFVLMQR